MIEQSIEQFIFEFIEQGKLLFFPEQWNHTFMDYTKNEVFAMFLVYRKGYANMTEIADYLGIPLNTATGIISRLEKRGVIERERDLIDKRVVTIAISQEGKDFLLEQLKIFEHYYQLFIGNISEEEKLLLMKLVGKFLKIVSEDLANNDKHQESKKTVRKIVIE